MTTQENDVASPTDGPDASSDTKASNDSEASNEKPEPDDAAKEKAADMMTAYEDRPTLILPGTGGAVSGTAVNDWLDEDGSPKYANDEDAPAAKAKSSDSSDDEAADDETSFEDQVEKDKEFNKAVIEAAKRRSDGDEDEDAKAKAAQDEKSVLS
jgi:hypothetical protein